MDPWNHARSGGLCAEVIGGMAGKLEQHVFGGALPAEHLQGTLHALLRRGGLVGQHHLRTHHQRVHRKFVLHGGLQGSPEPAEQHAVRLGGRGADALAVRVVLHRWGGQGLLRRGRGALVLGAGLLQQGGVQNVPEARTNPEAPAEADSSLALGLHLDDGRTGGCSQHYPFPAAAAGVLCWCASHEQLVHGAQPKRSCRLHLAVANQRRSVHVGLGDKLHETGHRRLPLLLLVGLCDAPEVRGRFAQALVPGAALQVHDTHHATPQRHRELGQQLALHVRAARQDEAADIAQRLAGSLHDLPEEGQLLSVPIPAVAGCRLPSPAGAGGNVRGQVRQLGHHVTTHT
mmetsp:Transcript_49960/g.149221  ORF Transcript_49960/g.149221 Transcript_49960/m.149221 type:complete len:345 (+) Transcript_49960:280-1314(+)